MKSLCLLLVLFFAGTAGVLAQPLLSHMEEGDQVRIHLSVSGCYRVEDNAYQFELKEGEIFCTGLILPDYVLPHRHPRAQVGPIVLSKEQIEAIDADIVRFRQAPLRSRSFAANGATVFHRANEMLTTTRSDAKLTFIEKGKIIIEESIHCPELSPADPAQREGLADLKRFMQDHAESEMTRIKKHVSEKSRAQQAEPAATP